MNGNVITLHFADRVAAFRTLNVLKGIGAEIAEVRAAVLESPGGVRRAPDRSRYGLTRTAFTLRFPRKLPNLRAVAAARRPPRDRWGTGHRCAWPRVPTSEWPL